MPRNAQVTRQWHLLRRLEHSAGLTLQQLADGLPDESRKHLRTLRQDLAALGSVGFPLLTEQVNGRTRWKLLDGFRRLPALGFAPSELMALVFSRDLLRPLNGTHIHAALDSAFGKASAALPPSGLDFVRQMREFLSVRISPHTTYGTHRNILWDAQEHHRPRESRDCGSTHRTDALPLGVEPQDRAARG